MWIVIRWHYSPREIWGPFESEVAAQIFMIANSNQTKTERSEYSINEVKPPN